MSITYNDRIKDLPLDQLHRLFVDVGWSPNCPLSEDRGRGFMRSWINSTLVVSAWDGNSLIGAVRVLSDTIFRSVMYDLLVAPEYQGKGIGKELVKQCLSHFPDSEWLVGCDSMNSGFYKGLGFAEVKATGEFLVIPCKLF